ncbi:LysR family transcriptional regulator [Rodentibacter haemolyticus]|uniref:LysR family transcriptional regulator n=1 Tax=Rodentibacter haemolyticus TaxID=2778911 RepID=A0ABX6UXA6_9PAST|nr:LysR family transcriptional regulator [Rodentibacter haemolyticus]QPB42487.1 LysR family transcriptional regulator [Rodentibacter haemolyticus]
MDIKHLRYFISIVDNGFNLSRASQHLYISQPALSIMINEFEQREGIALFKRSQGKIAGLTYIGENYYRDAKDILKRYHDMHTNLHHISKEINGHIRIGIPPLILSMLFSEVIPSLILDNPNIRFSVQETGAFVLKSELLLDKIDFAVLLYPEKIPRTLIDSFEIHASELSVFFSPRHRLAQKEILTWQDLNHEKMVLFDQSFMIHHLLKEAFERYNIYPQIITQSSSWDYLLSAVKSNSELLTILPLPIAEQFPSTEFICRRIEEPIKWKVTLCRLKKSNYSQIEDHILDMLLRKFEGAKYAIKS